MNTAKGTTPKALQFKLHDSNNGLGESFRVVSFYYGTAAAAGSVPFIWESQPGTPKHALTESSLPPLTPPPSYHQCSHKYNSSKKAGFLHNIFLASSRKKDVISSSHVHSWQSTPVSKTEVRLVCGEQEHASGGSPPCLDGGGVKRRRYKVNKMKQAIQWFVRHAN